MPDDVKILLIEDNPAYIRLVKELLVEAGQTGFDLEWAGLLEKGLDRLRAGGVDVVLLDLLLPDNMGTDTLRKVLDRAPDTPVVVLTGVDDEQLAREAVEMGAQDYLFKGRLDGEILSRSIRYALERGTEPSGKPGSTGLMTMLTTILPQLRARLGGIGGRAEGLGATVDEKLSEVERSQWATLETELDEAHRWVRGLELITQVEVSTFEDEPVDLEDAFDQALLHLQDGLSEGTTVTRFPLPTVHTDPDAIVHLFEHVLHALVASSGEQPSRIETEAVQTDEGLRLELTNQTATVDPDAQSRLAHAFSDAGLDEIEPGLALDALAARLIVDRLSGALWCEHPEPGVPCTVNVALPVQTISVEGLSDPDETLHGTDRTVHE